MGRTTYESIGRPLPGRTTIVLTRDDAWHADGVLVAHDLDEALRLADGPAGRRDGRRRRRRCTPPRCPCADEQVLTEVHLDPEGDVLYPAFEPAEWHEAERVPGAEYDRVRWVRRRDY